MENVKITPQWLIQSLVFHYYPDGKGNVRFSTYDSNGTSWVSLAIETLGITYKTYDTGKDNHYEIEWLVKIEDLKTDCIDLYTELKRLESSHLPCGMIKQN